MLHPGPLASEGAAIEVSLEAGASLALDEAADAAAPAQAFLRSAWFAAAAGDQPISTLVARRAGSGEAIAAIPLVRRRVGPVGLAEVAGCYWPFRSFPLAADAGTDELAALLGSAGARPALGRAWRVGPMAADDPVARALAAAAARSGWAVIERRVATTHRIDLAALTAAGPWPSVKRRQRNRWLERRLARDGELAFATVTGAAWDESALDALAAIEAHSWVAAEAGVDDLKFVPGARCRGIWERAIRHPDLASRLTAWLLRISGVPAAFVFCLDAGDTRHVIANGYDERFAEHSPGLVLLYRCFTESAEQGVRLIDWGAGDAGHKSRMGAVPGPELVDLLVVRGRARAALARPFWARLR